MNTAATVAVWLVASYLTGAIPFGFIIGKLRGVDVRKVGSKNIGATNVFRTVGKKWGLIAFACDVAKGFFPTYLCKHMLGHCDAMPAWLPLAVGIACVIGHMLTPYMKFKGGKGVATAFGMLIALAPILVAVAFAVFAVLFSFSQMISLGSCGAAAFLAVAVWFPALGVAGYRDLPQCILITLIALFVIWKHRANIVRIFSGTENKIYLFKSKAQVK